MSIYEPNFENTPEINKSLPCYYSEYSILYDLRGDLLLVHSGLAILCGIILLIF
jgi:hypothetical protein